MHGHSVSKSTRLNKNAHNKLIIIFLVLVLTFSSFFQSEQKAYANPLALGGGLTVGAGAYTLAALGIGSIVGIAGYAEYEREINAHAMRAWQNGTDIAKASMALTVQAAQGAGNAVTGLYTDFIKYVDGNLASLAQDTWAVKHQGYVIDNGIKFNFQSRGYNDGWGFFLGHEALTDMAFLVNGNKATSFEMTVSKWGARVSIWTPYMKDSITIIPNFTSVIESTSSLSQVELEMSKMQTFDQVAQYVQKFGISLHVAGEAAYDDFIGVQNNYQEAWRDMKDAGLVVPVDSAIPHANGKQITYNPDAGTYTGVDGGVINPSDVTWSFPVPRIRTDNVPVPGAYVDSPPITGVPAIDEAIAQNPAIPKTTTNINTGVTIANPDIATGNPSIPSDPIPETPGTAPKTPGSQPIVPIAILLALFDLLRAILMYLSRMFAFLVTIPFVVSIPIDNPYFQWFRTATILGVQPYPLVMSTAAFFMSFAAYKSIRRLLP